MWRCKMGRPFRTCSPVAANIPPPLWPRFSLGEGAAAAGEHLLPRCNCFPAVAAPHVADPPPPLPPAASAPLPPRCRFDSPAAGARRPRRGFGEGRRRAALKVAEKKINNEKNETEGGGRGRPTYSPGLGGKGTRRPRQQGVCGSRRLCAPLLHGHARLHSFEY